MAEFYSTKGISFHLENIIKKANNKIVIISPYLQMSQIVFEILSQVDKDIEITFVYGKSELKSNQKALLNQLNCNVYFKDNLHAKCYLNESSALISSMNLYSFSELNNYEMGVLLDKEKDNIAYRDCLKEVELIIANAKSEKSKKSIQNNSISEVKKNILPKLQIPICKGFDEALFNQNIKRVYDYLKQVADKKDTSDFIIENFPTNETSLGISYKVPYIRFNPNQSDNRSQLWYDYMKSVRSKYMGKLFAPSSEFRIFWNADKINLYSPIKYNFETDEQEAEYMSTCLRYVCIKLKENINIK